MTHNDIYAWRASYRRARHFGLALPTMQPMTVSEACDAEDRARDDCWHGIIDKRHLRDELEAIRAAEVKRLPNGRVKKRVRRHLLLRDGNACWLCGGAMDDGDMTIEHLKPRSRAGSHDLGNLALAHQSCNVRLGNKTMDEKLAIRAGMMELSQ